MPVPVVPVRLRGELWGLLRPYSGTLWAAGAALLLAAGTTLAVPAALRRVLDAGLAATSGEPAGELAAMQLNQHFLVLLILSLLLACGSALRYYLVSRLGERVVADLRCQVFGRLLNLDAAFFARHPPGELLSRINTDTTLVQGVVGSSLSVALRGIIMLCGGIIMLCVTSPRLAGYILLLVPLVIGPILAAGRRVRGLSRDAQDRVADTSRLADELLGSVPLVQAFTREEEELRRYTEVMELSFAAAKRRVRARAWLTLCAISLAFGAVLLVLWLGAREVLNGRMSPGELGQFVLYAILVAGSAAGLSEIWGELQRAAGAAERILELRRANAGLRIPDPPAEIKQPVRGRIEFRAVSFRYPEPPGSAPALHDLDFTVQAGETVALVGPSGSGKSTVFRLLLRQYDPDRGAILLDGVELARLQPRLLRGCIAYVPQEPVLFSTSLEENIRFGKSEATEPEVRAAARAAHVDEFIAMLAGGYRTGLGERGANISGGQRQRVALARALLRDAPLLLLDEPTSALDNESAKQVRDSMELLTRNRTTLVIAHSLVTVQRADRILVLEQGRVIDQGGHGELLARCPLYTRLAQLEFAAALPRAHTA